MQTRRHPITVQRFFRLALLLPVVVPVLFVPFIAMDGTGVLSTLAGALLVGSTAGLLPYAAVAARLHAWSGRAPEDALRRLAWESCVLMTLETGLFVLFATWSVVAALWFAAYAAVYSLGYVGLAHVLLVIGRAAGLVAPRERLASADD